MLEPLFGSAKKEKILLYLYTHREAYAREIARVFQFNLNTVQNQLLNLEKDGVLFSQLRGKVRLFGINPRYSFKKELEALLEKVLLFLPGEEVAEFYRPRTRPRRTRKPL
jgi:predicted ArsR family transcriptional regulator